MFSLVKKLFMGTIHIKCFNGNIEAVKQHLDNGVDVDAKSDNGRTPLHTAVSNDHKEIAELLIEKGADVNAKLTEGNFKGDTPLDRAIWASKTFLSS